MICSSMNLLLYIAIILLVDGLSLHSAGTAGRWQVKSAARIGCAAVEDLLRAIWLVKPRHTGILRG